MENNIMPSPQRMAVMQFLTNNPIHPTVETVYSALVDEIPTLSKTTVYNTLQLFYDKGIVRAINIEEKNIRYDADTSEHAHFICKKCGKIMDIAIDSINNISIYSGNNKVTEMNLYLAGICEICNNQCDKL
ncbi:MAG: transcriptional repressor [Bacteroidales bacterium]|nr:transcriptional repressor [Bacteroidales bacterium]